MAGLESRGQAIRGNNASSCGCSRANNARWSFMRKEGVPAAESGVDRFVLRFSWAKDN